MTFALGASYSIKEALLLAVNFLDNNNVKESTAIAEILLAHYCMVSRPALKLNAANIVNPEILQNFYNALKQSAAGMPLAYILGTAQFLDFTLKVNPNVLIPRPETEEMVQHAFGILKTMPENVKVLDLCTGSGAIAIAVKRRFLNANITACDISQEALNVARENACMLGAKSITFINSDLFNNIGSAFDIIISNPPYITRGQMSGLDVCVKQEPRLALDGGEDGLDIIKNIARNAPKFLNRGGCIIMEHGINQHHKIAAMFKNEVESYKDYQNINRFIVARF